MCKFHKDKNESETLKEFKKSLDPAQLPPTGAKYFFVMPQHQYVMSTQSQNTAPVVKVDKEGYDILPDVDEPSIFMLQTISFEFVSFCNLQFAIILDIEKLLAFCELLVM